MNESAAKVLARLDQLAACTDEPGSITRLYLTPAHRRAASLVQGWMEEAGLRAALDASATLVGRREASRPGAPCLILGSHIDTVRNAGRYDGCLGVVAAIAVAERLRGADLPFALEIRAFGDEEGVRFPVTLTGARATAGTFDANTLQAADADGITLGQALTAWGRDPEALGECRAADAFAYLELHIEQGPVLEEAHLPLSVVTAIAGAIRMRATVTGQAGHAGTVPMPLRRDALAAAAAMVLAVREIARAEEGVVATVGQIAVAPDAVNVIPGECRFTIDLRAPDDRRRDAALAALVDALHAVARRESVSLALETTHQAAAVACDRRLQNALAEAIIEAGQTMLALPSGAGHDAMAVASLCPVGMLFLRCAGGISHNPAESVRADDLAVALDVLTAVVTRLDPAHFAIAGRRATLPGQSWPAPVNA